MRVLAIDTTSEFGSLAAAEDGAIVADLILHSAEGFSRTVFDHVRALLDRAGWAAGEVDCFAAAAGPGSFTGVRVGLAAAKGLAEALGRRAAAVSNLEAVASFGTAERRAALLDARRGQIYGALYDASLNHITPETAAPLPEWLVGLPAGEIEFLSTDFGPFRDALAGRWMTEVPRALAGAVARIAARREWADPAAIDANYVRRSDAELFWVDR
jgi:tRNA threonylcarbamoyladenosine biosynthesis protein TsaB